MNRIFKFENELLNKKLNNQKTILELSKIDNLALWWYVDLDFFNFLMNLAHQQIHHKIHVKNNKEKVHEFLIVWFLRFYDYLLKIISIIIVHILNKPVNDHSKKRYTVLITGEDIEWRPIITSSHKKFRMTDQFFDSILEMMQNAKKFRVVSIYPIKYPIYRSILTIISKYKNWYVQQIPFDYYFTVKCDKKRNEYLKYFKKIWTDIENDQTLDDLLNDYDPLQAPAIKEKLRNYFIYHTSENVFSEFVKKIEMANNVITSIQPDVVIIEEEYGVFERSILIAAKLRKIPTIAIQHGVIHEFHKGYIFTNKDISPDLSISFPYTHIADITAVYGDYHKMLLTKISSYPDKAIVVTGQPRYDRIDTLRKNFNRNDFLQYWKIPTRYRLLLWLPSLRYLSKKELERDLYSIIEGLKEIEDLKILIKPHPGDPDHSIFDLQKKLNELNSPAIIIPKNYDTLYCILASDLVVMKDSTTGMEAIALGKPLIQLNLENSIDQVDYVGQGVGFGIYSVEDLKPMVLRILNNDLKISEEERTQYLKEYFHRIDGQASTRIVKLIEQCINYKREK